MTADPAAPAMDITVSEPAPAKINLFLHVTGRRADGYHLLQSLVVFAGIGDTVTAERSAMLSLSLAGPFGDVLEVSEDNLVLRAALALQDRVHRRTGARPGAALLLTKRLPVASGIGGGSADAAATLRALARLWALDIPPTELEALALPLGADVPVCIGARARMMGGIGDRLDDIPALPPVWIVLANPMRGIETRSVFAARDAGAVTAPLALPARFASAAELADWLARETRNDLAPAARSILPDIARIEGALGALPGALHAGMSGSGATCFALFATRGAAAEGAQALRAAEPGWWIEAAALGTETQYG